MKQESIQQLRAWIVEQGIDAAGFDVADEFLVFRAADFALRVAGERRDGDDRFSEAGFGDGAGIHVGSRPKCAANRELRENRNGVQVCPALSSRGSIAQHNHEV